MVSVSDLRLNPPSLLRVARHQTSVKFQIKAIQGLRCPLWRKQKPSYSLSGWRSDWKGELDDLGKFNTERLEAKKPARVFLPRKHQKGPANASICSCSRSAQREVYLQRLWWHFFTSAPPGSLVV